MGNHRFGSLEITSQLRRAIAEAEKLPAVDQDALAARLLAEVQDERRWNARFAATTDGQWECMVAEVRGDIEAGRTLPLDDVIPPDEPAR